MITDADSNKRRLFYAVQLDAAAREYATQAQRALRESPGLSRARHFRWVNPVDMHLTLFFLGEQSADDIPAFMAAGNAAAAQGRPFTLNLRGLGQFPSDGAARVVWLGAHEAASQQANGLASRLRTNLKSFGADRVAFNPHITLGYVRPSADQKELSRTMKHSLVDPRVTEQHDLLVSQFVLMESLRSVDLRDTGKSRYTVVHSFLLA